MKTRRLLNLVSVVTAVVLGFYGAVEAAYGAAWTFGNVLNDSYRLDAASPNAAELGANILDEDPTLILQLGKRYQVTVTNFGFHPFQVIAKGATFSSDIVLLSMGNANGLFESDTAVDWMDNGAGTVTFTLTFDLYDAMTTATQQPGYRCGVHVSSMRGNFTVLGTPIVETIQKGDVAIELETVASGLAAPVDLKPAADGTERLFVVDQAGTIRIIQNGQLLTEPFLDVSSRLVSPLGIIGSHDVNDFDERGLLSVALHPGFAEARSNGFGKIYTYTSEPNIGGADFTTNPPPTDVNHQTVIAEWAVDVGDPNLIDAGSRREILRIEQPQFNHNAGMLAFGPDGYLYTSLGDGGNANDQGDGHGTTGNGQNTETVHGSILRIDPLDPALTAGSGDANSANGKYRTPADNPFVGVSGIDEIFAYGLRNPYRFSFDSATGELVVADVGQDNIEEIDSVENGGNYGWNLKEGTFRFDPKTGAVSGDLSGLPVELIDPVAQYDHDDGLAIVGGYIYRGSAIPELFGKYVFGDFSTGFFTPTGRLFYADLDIGQINEFIIGVDDRELGLFVKGFGRNTAGEIYLLASSNLGPFGTGGVVLKIVDLCTTRIPGDINNDCEVNFRDFAILASSWLENTVR